MYDNYMKFVLLALFVLFAAQPLPVAACDMHAGQETTHDPAGTMPDGPIDHDTQAMDCCDQGSDNAGDGCGFLSHCATCPMGLVALTPSAPGIGIEPVSQPCQPAAGLSLNRAASPPFKPPIA